MVCNPIRARTITTRQICKKKYVVEKEMYRNLEPPKPKEEPDAWQCCKLLECCECCLLWIYW